jgi:septal ring factor EnvC (AmiA/AmiB activator)
MLLPDLVCLTQEAATLGAKARQEDSETASTLQASLHEVESLAETLRGEKSLLEQRLEQAAESAIGGRERRSSADRQIVSPDLMTFPALQNVALPHPA